MNQLVTILPKKILFCTELQVTELENISTLVCDEYDPWYIADVNTCSEYLEAAGQVRYDDTNGYILDTEFILKHHIMISNITLLKDHPMWENEDMCMKLLEDNPEIFPFIKVQTPEICSRAMELPSNLEHVKNQTEELCIEAMENDTEDYSDVDPIWHSLGYVKEQTLPIVMAAIKTNPDAYPRVKEPFRSNRNVILEVLKRGGSMICYVPEQTPEYCEVALENDPMCLKWCKCVSRELLEKTVTKHPQVLSEIENQDEKLCGLAITSDPEAAKYIRKDEDFDRALEKLFNEGKLSSSEILSLKISRYPHMKAVESFKNKPETKEEFVKQFKKV